MEIETESDFKRFTENLLNYRVFDVEPNFIGNYTLFHMEMNNYDFHIVYRIDEYSVKFHECCAKLGNGRMKLGLGCEYKCPLEKISSTTFNPTPSCYGNLN